MEAETEFREICHRTHRTVQELPGSIEFSVGLQGQLVRPAVRNKSRRQPVQCAREIGMFSNGRFVAADVASHQRSCREERVGFFIFFHSKKSYPFSYLWKTFQFRVMGAGNE